MRTTAGKAQTTIELTERETACWEDSGPDGDQFRRSVRDRANALGGYVEIHSHDGIVFETVETEAVSDDDMERARDDARRAGNLGVAETCARAMAGDIEARIEAVRVVRRWAEAQETARRD